MGHAEPLSAGMQKLLSVASKYFTEESRLKGMRFKPSPTDVFICTGDKCGTTWVQQICHGLRSGGDMSFDEITLVSPCLEMAHDSGYEDLEAPQPYAPRMYKTHLWYHSCPKGAGKYIVVHRRPLDAALSYFHFLENWVYDEGEVALEEFVNIMYMCVGEPKGVMDNASHFHHLLSWLPHRFDDNVLWLHYEDLQQDLRGCVRLIANFLDIGKDDDNLQDLVTRQASLGFMKQHAAQFDEHPIKTRRNEVAGLPKDAGLRNNAGKVRNGEVHSSKSLPSHIQSMFSQKWNGVIKSQLGFENYEAMRAAINKDLDRHFT